MDTLSSPRHRLAGLAFLLALGVGLVMTVPALADYLGPDRTVTTWEWRRLQCHYEAVYNPPGAGWYGCTLDLYNTPDSSCPLGGSVAGYFTPSACGWSEPYCQTYGCAISRSGSVGSCNEGETGCTAVERTTTLPEATVSGSVSCAVPGAGGWCLAEAGLSLTGSEPLAGYSILTLEGTRNIIPGGGGETFACLGALCDVPLVEGTNDFAFWAISSWGDTSLMGTTSGGLDTQPPVISGEISGTTGDNGWYLSDVAFSASANDPSPGSGLIGFELSLDGGTWTPYTGPLSLSDGSHTVELRAADAAGNVGTQSQAVRVDTQPPVISGEISGTTGDNGWYLSDVAFSASASDPSPGSGLLSLELSLDGGAWVAYTGPLTFSDGSHTVELRAGDTAGNMSTQSQAVRVDTQPPGLDLIANDFFCPGCGEQLEIAVDVQDAGSGVVEWTLSADAGLVASGSGPTSQVLPWDGSGLPGGPYTLSLRACDAAGNTSETSLAVSLLVPTPAPPPAELPPAETPPGSGPTWSTAVQLATPTVVPTATRPSRPTRTPEVIPFGGVPAVPLGNEGEDTRSNPSPEILGGPQPSVPGSSSGVLWGGAALALIGAATAIALDQARRRREEEARQREEMERRNAAQRAREAAERARIAAAAAAAEAARERTEEASRQPEGETPTTQARVAPDPWTLRAERLEEEEEARRLAAATAQGERLRAIAEGREEAPVVEPPWWQRLVVGEIVSLLRALPQLRARPERVRTPMGRQVLPFGMLTVGRVTSLGLATNQNPNMWIAIDGRSLGARAGSPQTSVTATPEEWRAGFRFPGQAFDVRVPVDPGDPSVYHVATGWSVYAGFHPAGFWNSTVTLDLNLIDMSTPVTGAVFSGQSGVYVQFKPGPLAIVAVAATAVVLLFPEATALVSRLVATGALRDVLGAPAQ